MPKQQPARGRKREQEHLSDPQSFIPFSKANVYEASSAMAGQPLTTGPLRLIIGGSYRKPEFAKSASDVKTDRTRACGGALRGEKTRFSGHRLGIERGAR